MCHGRPLGELLWPRGLSSLLYLTVEWELSSSCPCVGGERGSKQEVLAIAADGLLNLNPDHFSLFLKSPNWPVLVPGPGWIILLIIAANSTFKFPTQPGTSTHRTVISVVQCKRKGLFQNSREPRHYKIANIQRDGGCPIQCTPAKQV